MIKKVRVGRRGAKQSVRTLALEANVQQRVPNEATSSRMLGPGLKALRVLWPSALFVCVSRSVLVGASEGSGDLFRVARRAQGIDDARFAQAGGNTGEYTQVGVLISRISGNHDNGVDRLFIIFVIQASLRDAD